MEMNAIAGSIADELRSSHGGAKVVFRPAEGEVYARGPEIDGAFQAAVARVMQAVPASAVQIKTGFGSASGAAGPIDHAFLSVTLAHTLGNGLDRLLPELLATQEVSGLKAQLQGSNGFFQLRPHAPAKLQIMLSLPAEESLLDDAAAGEGTGKTVLLVEDEDFVRNVTREVLEMSGYTVLEASSGDAGIELFRSHSGKVDLLLTDVVMPGMNGRDLAARLSELEPHLKTIFMSGYTEVPMLFSGQDEECIAYLQKPFALDTLTAKVREILSA